MDIIGHQNIIEILARSVKNNKVAHAYLFYGPAHVGKTRVALEFAARLLSGGREQVFKGIHPDLVFIKKESRRISINQIRSLGRILSLSPLYAPYKVAIIEEAEALTLEAANSFLKLLEEPSTKSVIILITKDLSSIPWTVRSRTQILRFSIPRKNELLDFFENNFGISRQEALDLLALSLMRPGKAIDFLTNPSSLQLFRENLARIIELLSNPQEFESAENISIQSLVQVIRDLILTKLGLEPTAKGFEALLKSLAQKYTKEKLLSLAGSALETQFYLLHNVTRPLAMENLLLKC